MGVVPATIGRYRAVRVLGTGTFATVFLADDPALDAQVALKLLAENWSLDPDVRARFIREARVLRRTDDRRIVKVHDIGEFEHRPYFVMDYVAGGTLSDRLTRCPLLESGPAPEPLLHLAREIAASVGAAHHAGVVHRDVKPSNLLVRPAPGGDDSTATTGATILDKDETLVLADFGFARDLTAGSGLSLGAGTRGFMAPEQLDPTAPVDERTDIYAMSAVLLLAVTGASAATLANRGRRDRLLAGLPPDLAHVLRDSLAEDRDSRPRDTAEWCAALEHALDPAAPSAPPSATRPRPAALPGWLERQRRHRLVGRRDELRRVADLWERVEAGDRHAVLVAGEPGIGKTRLLAEIARRYTRAGAIVIAGRCDEALSVAYGAVVDALRPLTGDARLREVLDDLGPRREHLGRLFPDLFRGETATEGGSLDGTVDEQRHVLFDTIDVLLTSMAGPSTPTLLLVDDIHAAHDSTLALLRHLVRSSRPGALMVVGTYRNTETESGHPLVAWHAGLRRDGLVDRITLEGLDEPELAHLVDDRTARPASPSSLHRLKRRTAGNPLFAGELLRDLADQGLRLENVDTEVVPDDLRDLVLTRFQRLHPATQRILRITAVAGAEPAGALVAAVAGTDTARALDEADHAAIVATGSDGQLAFRHQLFQEAILGDTPATERAALHWQIGEALEAREGPATDEHLGEIARHLRLGVSAGDRAKAADALVRAAEHAHRALAIEEALVHLEDARTLLESEPPDDALLIGVFERLAEVHYWRSDVDAMRSCARLAFEVARRSGSAVDLARTAIAAARQYRPGEQVSAILEMLDEALAVLADGDDALRSRVLAMRAFQLHGATRSAAARTAARAAEAIARRIGETEALNLSLLARTYVESGSADTESALSVADELRATSEQLGRSEHAALALRARGIALLVRGDRPGFTAARAELGAAADQLRLAAMRNQALQWDAALALAEGRFSAGEEIAADAVAAWDVQPGPRLVYLAQIATAALERGEYERVLGEIERFVAADETSIGYTWRAVVASGRAASGSFDEALALLAPLAASGFASLGDDYYRPQALRYLAEAAATTGHAGIAKALLPLVDPYRGLILVGPSATTVEGAADRALGQLLLTLERHVEADAALGRAVALEHRLGLDALETRSRWWWARAVYGRGGPGDHDRARELATDAAGRAERLAMAAVARSARALAAAVPTGEPTRGRG